MSVYIHGEEFRLGRGGGTDNYTLDRLNSTGSIIIPKGSVIIPALASTNSFLDIVWVGTNDSPLEINTYLEKLKLIDRAKNNMVLFIGVSKRGSNDIDLASFEPVLQREFGSRFVNLREYLITNAIYDAAIEPTAQDLVDIANGYPPASLLNDATHYNEYGQKVIAKFVAERIKQLITQRILPIY